MPRLDFVIFGASGFTGKHTVKYLIRISKGKASNFTWGIAGRSKERLLNILNELSKTEPINISEVPLIIADVNDPDSLNKMAQQAKVLINCCGPYRFYGEPVINACIENKTHHVDISGEPAFMERMQLKYHEKALEKEVYVVSACGFDSIPADMGIVFLKNKFDGDLNSVEIYLKTWTVGGRTGSGVHYGTWESAVYGSASESELPALRKKLFLKPWPCLVPKLKPKHFLFKSKFLSGKWCLPFPGSDRSVIKRSQYYFYENDKERPVQIGVYIAFTSLFIAIAVVFFAVLFSILSKFSFGRKILLNHPKFFSLGYASCEGPPEDEADNTYFEMTFKGEGWKDKLSDSTDIHLECPDKGMVAKVHGRNPGYGTTPITLIVSALVILKENNKMPSKGGVYPPGAAFAKTSMIQQLNDLGVKFEIIG